MQKYQCLIIGAGPGGYVAAIRAGQLGLKTAIVEREHMGGMCLNWGCIPSKSMIESARLFERLHKAAAWGIDGVDPAALSFNWSKALARKDGIVTKLVKGVSFLMKKNGVDVLKGDAELLDAHRVRVGELEVQCDHLLLATGSRPDPAPFGEISSSIVQDMKQFFGEGDRPASALVYGGNIVALEITLLLKSLGSHVEVALPGDTLLPGLDGALRAWLMQRLKRLKVPVHTGVTRLLPCATGVRVGEKELAVERVLNCADRLPVIPAGLNPATTGKALKVDEHCRTSIPSVYAAGDVTGQELAQAAMTMGIAAVEHMAGKGQPVDFSRIPLNIYTDPEIASVGLSEEQLQERNVPYRKGEFPLSANGRALAGGAAEGFIKVLADERLGEIVGVHIVAPNATDMIAQAVSLLNLETTLEEVARMVHAHPSLSEVLWEAHLDALGRPLHK
ncbi:MAG: dihydrolipoyl dehydrogenase [Candidatus Cloacimonetes bacterium]|nr:dihydrolipoyl dehydrogenase [Candidatus Cloacimonadota bacterium]